MVSLKLLPLYPWEQNWGIRCL